MMKAPKKDEHEDEGNGDDADEDVRHHQAPPESPEQTGTDEPQQANQVVDAGNQRANPEDEPEESGDTARGAGEAVRDLQGGAVSQNPRGESRQAVRPVFVEKEFEAFREHICGSGLGIYGTRGTGYGTHGGRVFRSRF